MSIHQLAGKKAPPELLIDVSALEAAYVDRIPNLDDNSQWVAFGTSGHRGTPSNGSFTEAHILAVTQAICEYRKSQEIKGPLYMGMDSHALSRLAQRTALEVLIANDVDVFYDASGGFTPTPAVSHAILSHNRSKPSALADGIIITPSHNPPQDGGFKYNSTNGGPADTDITGWIQQRANELLRGGNRDVLRTTYDKARSSAFAHPMDFISPYVESLGSIIDMDAIRAAGVRIGVDPLGGASLAYWAPIADRYGLNLEIVNDGIDPQFGFMFVDHDGKIRMDCSSPYAMAGLVSMKDRFDLAFGNDPDADRHGIVTPSRGLLNPNHFLAVSIRYLLAHRPGWAAGCRIGKTLVSSNLIDRVVAAAGRPLLEVPVGFKWFTPGLFDGSVCFGGEESAGASFLRKDGSVWSTDKDGLIMGLLAAEITAVTGKDPGIHLSEILDSFGEPSYTRIDAPASPAQKAAFKKLTPASVAATHLAGGQITARLTRAPGNNADIGGLKVCTHDGWFAARPSGTENLYKIYAESFLGPIHLAQIVEEAKDIVGGALCSE